MSGTQPSGQSSIDTSPKMMTPSQWKWKFLNGKAENAEVLWRCEEEPILNTPLNHDTVSGTQSRFSARVFKGSHWNWLKESGQITTQHGSIWTRYTVMEESSRTQSCKIFWNLNNSTMAKTPDFVTWSTRWKRSDCQVIWIIAICYL